MTGPDTRTDVPGNVGRLDQLGGSVGNAGAGADLTGRGPIDAVIRGADRRSGDLSMSGQNTAATAADGVRSIGSGDDESAERFGRNGVRGGNPSGRGGFGGPGGLFGPAQSSMPGPGRRLQALPGAAESVQSALPEVTKPLQGLLSAPSQFVSPLTSMLGGAAPGLSSVSPMSSAGSSSGSGGSLSGGFADRLNQFVSGASGRVPYVWGGGHGSQPGITQGRSDGGNAGDAHGDYNKQGVDCSGFTRWALAEATGTDVLGASTSETQYNGGQAVSSPQPGDLAFPASAGRPPQHVQIYIGGGMVAEAPQSGEMVRVREMSPGTEFRRYVTGA